MTTTQPKKPYTSVDFLDNHIFIIEGKFAGANYKELENEMADRLVQTGGYMDPGFSLDSSTIKGLLWVQAVKMPPESLVNRPHATIIAFKFPLARDKSLIKGFSIG